MRSNASLRQRLGTSGSGLRHARSNMPGVRMRPISSTSRKPRVVSNPVRAPVFCKIVFEATVVPCTTSVTSRGSRPASASTAATPIATPSPGSIGVVVVLFTCMRPSESVKTTSVKVPPTSTPMRAPRAKFRPPVLIVLSALPPAKLPYHRGYKTYRIGTRQRARFVEFSDPLFGGEIKRTALTPIGMSAVILKSGH